jgi:flagellar FliL protein
MSESKPAADQDAAPRRNRKKIILILVTAVALLGGGAAAFILTRPAPAADAGKAANAKAKESEKPFFVEFESFTTNLKTPDKFLQLKLTFQVKSDKAAESLKELTPLVRSAVVPVLASQEAAELMSAEGKARLCSEVAEAVNKALASRSQDEGVDSVLIVHMLIQ